MNRNAERRNIANRVSQGRWHNGAHLARIYERLLFDHAQRGLPEPFFRARVNAADDDLLRV